MINALIIDDEQHCIDSLVSDLKTHCSGSVNIQDTCISAKAGIMAIKKYHPQLLFLDVEMPWINGFEMLELLPSINFCIIFTTAYDRFAAKAFRISAIDYLLKPIDSSELINAIHKVEEKLINDAGIANIENLLHNFHQPDQHQKIALPNQKGYEFTQVSSILYCTAEGSYTRVVLKDKQPVLISRTLGDIEEVLPHEIFCRIHHSTIVNLNSIIEYNRSDGGYIVISTKEKLTVSKARKDELLRQLGLRS